MVMKKTIYRIYIRLSLFALCAATLSCEPETAVITDTGTPVLQGYLYAGQPVDSILVTLSFTRSGEDTVAATLDDLALVLSDGIQHRPLDFAGRGVYRLPDWIMESGKTYSLSFERDGKTISAQTYIPTKKEASISVTQIELTKIEAGTFPPNFGEQPDPVEITWENPEGDYFYVVVKNIAENPEYVNEIFETGELMNRRFSFISRPQATNYYSIDPRREIRQFGNHQIIVYRVNPEYAALYEVSNSTSLSITEPPGNVENGLGIFTGVSSDTLYLTVKKK